jgi:hypothetical protein
MEELEFVDNGWGGQQAGKNHWNVIHFKKRLFLRS